MKQALLFLLLCVLLVASVSASVIPARLTEQKCGNGIKEGYELCEPDTAYDLCPSIGKFLKVAMVCDERNCACLPGESAKDCGNGIREGVEMCESDKKGSPFDLCPNMSQIIGVPLKCELSSCDCINDGLPIKISTCGDKNVEGYEDCEADDDCPKGRTCTNCTCTRNDVPLNITPVERNVTLDDVPVLTVEEIIRKQKQTVLNFVLDDYVGEVLPEALDYFDEEVVNIKVALKNGDNATVSVVTTEMVVQEVHNYALNDSTLDVWLDEDAVAALKASDNRTATIVSFLETGKIGYKPTGFFRRVWFLFFTPF